MENLAEITFRVGNIGIVYNTQDERICIDGVTFFDVSDSKDLSKVFTEIQTIKDKRDSSPNKN